MRNAPTNSDDVIDSRDVIARIEELEEERQEAIEAAESPLIDTDASEGELNLAVDAAGKEWDESEEGQELAALKALAEQCEGYAADWRHGETLIRDSYFETYAQELADDIGAINSDAGWPNNCIDWARAARELQMDYTQVDFDGVAYWIR